MSNPVPKGPPFSNFVEFTQIYIMFIPNQEVGIFSLCFCAMFYVPLYYLSTAIILLHQVY